MVRVISEVPSINSGKATLGVGWVSCMYKEKERDELRLGIVVRS